MARSTSSKSVVVFGDLHDGSRYAVKSPDATISEEDGPAVHSPQNPVQKKLYEAWEWAIDELEQRPYVFCLNGEPIDGANTKSYGKSNWTTDINDQMEDAIRLLKMYPCDHFLMTRGTPYHTTRDATNFEETVARMMNATPYRGYMSEKVDKVGRDSSKPEGQASARTDYYLWFTIFGKLFSITHHVGFNRWFAYRTTAIAREMADLEFARGKWYAEDTHPSFIIRSHVHYFVGVMFGSTFGCTTPAWKLPDPHLLKGGLGGTAPSIGNVEIIIEQNGQWVIRPHILPTKYYPKPRVLEL